MMVILLKFVCIARRFMFRSISIKTIEVKVTVQRKRMMEITKSTELNRTKERIPNFTQLYWKTWLKSLKLQMTGSLVTWGLNVNEKLYGQSCTLALFICYFWCNNAMVCLLHINTSTRWHMFTSVWNCFYQHITHPFHRAVTI